MTAGATFGVATTLLPVPELIPVRMTPQFIGALSPLPALGLLRTLITAALGALSAPSLRSQLLIVMDTFARDPTLDWQVRWESNRKRQASWRGSQMCPPSRRQATAKKKVRVSAAPADGDAAAGPGGGGAAELWLPRARVLAARLKLSRANPAAVMALDLLQNASYASRLPAARHEALGAARAAIAGVPWAATGGRATAPRLRSAAANNAPAALPPWQRALLEAALGGPLSGNAAPALNVAVTLCPDVAAQVECLLDLATDPNILARQWAGLATWC